MVADRFGLPLATLIPTATVAGVALGFGAQRVPHDIVSGFFLLAEHQMAIGDWVTIAARGTVGGVGGNVEQITLRVTRLRTIEGEVVFVPDGEIRQLTSQSIGWVRSVVDVPLRPEGDLAPALSTLRKVSDEMRGHRVVAGATHRGARPSPSTWSRPTRRRAPFRRPSLINRRRPNRRPPACQRRRQRRPDPSRRRRPAAFRDRPPMDERWCPTAECGHHTRRR